MTPPSDATHATPAADRSPAVPPGIVDMHSHLLPGIDDGCADFSESLACIRHLQNRGYVGSICTPHIWPEQFPDNTPSHVHAWTDQLRTRLRNEGVDYRLWSGGELRLSRDVVDYFKAHGVPTLADSRYVLCDFWECKWPRWVDRAFDWLLAEDYQPVLAHPERLGVADLPKHLDHLHDRGVLLQGNFRCLTGGEGPVPHRWVRQFLTEDRYTFMALDMHGPGSLDSRLLGLTMARQDFGTQNIDAKVIDAPRQRVLGLREK